jgi:hypothetical protein
LYWKLFCELLTSDAVQVAVNPRNPPDDELEAEELLEDELELEELLLDEALDELLDELVELVEPVVEVVELELLDDELLELPPPGAIVPAEAINVTRSSLAPSSRLEILSV